MFSSNFISWVDLQIYIFIFFTFNSLNINSLNINGLNNKDKQLMLIDFMKYNKIDILLVQEHNLRDTVSIISELNDQYHVLINLSIAHKGGTAILIDKRLDLKIIHHEMSADSRIISANIEIYNNSLHLLNIYSPSGSRNSDRDNFYRRSCILFKK